MKITSYINDAFDCISVKDIHDHAVAALQPGARLGWIRPNHPALGDVIDHTVNQGISVVYEGDEATEDQLAVAMASELTEDAA